MNSLPIKSCISITDVMSAGTAHLTGEDNFFPTCSFRHPGTNDTFGMSVGLGPYIDGIHLGRIKKINTVLPGMVHLVKPFLSSVLLTPCHGTEADYGNIYPRVT